MSAIVPEELDQWMTAARNEGDQAAFAQVVHACHHLVRATILRDTADPELADEIAQEVFVRAWTRRQQYRVGTNVRAWLMAIARSQLIDFHRRRQRDQRHLHELIRKELLRQRATWDDSETELQALRRECLNDCLRELDDDQRQLLDLVHGQGLRTEDAAEILDIRPATCRQRLSRLQRSLRQCAEEKMRA